MRVGVVMFLHESNTFLTQRTTLDHFAQDVLATGEAVRRQMAGAHHEVGGFFEGLADAQIEAVPIFAARAVPGGVIEADSFARLMEHMQRATEAAGTLDGVLAAAHGATVSEAVADVDGHWLAWLREYLGSQTPLVATIDPHANLSSQMVAATDALVAYRTNPHIDQRARGVEAATLIARHVRGEVRLTQAARMPPLAISIERQETDAPPCSAWCALAEEIRARPGVLSVSPVLGFPYADVAEVGSAAVVVTDGDPKLASDAAEELARHAWHHREEFRGPFLGLDEALDQLPSLQAPVCLLDMGDNVGGGSAADGTYVAHALHARAIAESFVCLFDPAAVSHVATLKRGQAARLRLGGKTDTLHGPPLEVECTLVGLYDGKFREDQPRHGGFRHFDQGPTAVVRTTRGMTVMLTSRRTPPWSLAQLTHCDLRPADFAVLVAKGVNAPLAAYQEVCQSFVRVNTPGSTCADMTQLPFSHRRMPMFPFERDAEYA